MTDKRSKMSRQMNNSSEVSLSPFLQDLSETSLSNINPDTLFPSDSSFFEQIEDYEVVMSDMELDKTENINMSGQYPSDSSIEEDFVTKENIPVFKKPFRARVRKRPRSDLFDSILNSSESATSESKVLQPFRAFRARVRKRPRSDLFDSILNGSESATSESKVLQPLQNKTKSRVELSNDSFNNSPIVSNFFTRRKRNGKNMPSSLDLQVTNPESDFTSPVPVCPKRLKKTKKINGKEFDSVFSDSLDSSQDNNLKSQKLLSRKVRNTKINSPGFEDVFENITNESQSDMSTSQKKAKSKFNFKKLSVDGFDSVFDDTLNESHTNKQRGGKFSRVKMNSKKLNPAACNFDGVFSDSLDSSQDNKPKNKKQKLLSKKIKNKKVNSLVFDDVFNSTSNGSQSDASTSQKKTRLNFNLKKVSSEDFDSVFDQSLNGSCNSKVGEKLSRLKMNSKKTNSAVFNDVFEDSANETPNDKEANGKLSRVKINIGKNISTEFNDIFDESLNKSYNNKIETQHLSGLDSEKLDSALFNDVFEDTCNNSQNQKSASESKERQTSRTKEANKEANSVASDIDFSLHKMSNHISFEKDKTNVCLELEAEQNKDSKNTNTPGKLINNLINEKKDSKLVSNESDMQTINCISHNSKKEGNNVDVSGVVNPNEIQPTEVNIQDNNKNSMLSESVTNAVITFPDVSENQTENGERDISFQNNSDDTLTIDEKLTSVQENEIIAEDVNAEIDRSTTLVGIDQDKEEDHSFHYSEDSKQAIDTKHEMSSKIVIESGQLGFNMDVPKRKSCLLINARKFSSLSGKKVSFRTSNINEAIICSTPITQDKVRVSCDTRLSINNYFKTLCSPHEDNLSEINKTSFSLDPLVIEGLSENMISNSATIDLHPSTIKSNSASTSADSNSSKKGTSQTTTTHKNRNLNVSKYVTHEHLTLLDNENEQSEKSKLSEDGESESKSNVEVTEMESVEVEEMEEDETNTENEESVHSEEDYSGDCNESSETVENKSEVDSDEIDSVEITGDEQSSKEITEESDDCNENEESIGDTTEEECDQIKEMEVDEGNPNQQSIPSVQFREDGEGFDEEIGGVTPNELRRKSDKIEENINVTENDSRKMCQAESRTGKDENVPPDTSTHFNPQPNVQCSSRFKEPRAPKLSKRQIQDFFERIPLSELRRRRRKPRVSQISTIQIQQDEIENCLKKRQEPGDKLFSKKPKLKRPRKWVSPKFYEFLINKLTPKFGIKSRLRAENVVLFIVEHVDVVLKKENDWFETIEEMKIELANLNVIKTHWDFHELVLQYFDAPFYDKLYRSGAMNTLEPEDPDETIL